MDKILKSVGVFTLALVLSTSLYVTKAHAVEDFFNNIDTGVNIDEIAEGVLLDIAEKTEGFIIDIENPSITIGEGIGKQIEIELDVEKIIEDIGVESAIDAVEEAVKARPRDKAMYKELSKALRIAEGLGKKVSRLPVFADGFQVDFDVEPTIINNRTIVPIRKIAEAVGGEVGWDGATKRVSITKGEKKVEFTVGSKEAYLNGRKITLEAPSKIIGGRTMVPLRFVGEALGTEVNWDPDYQTITILSK